MPYNPVKLKDRKYVTTFLAIRKESECAKLMGISTQAYHQQLRKALENVRKLLILELFLDNAISESQFIYLYKSKEWSLLMDQAYEQKKAKMKKRKELVLKEL